MTCIKVDDEMLDRLVADALKDAITGLQASLKRLKKIEKEMGLLPYQVRDYKDTKKALKAAKYMCHYFGGEL